MKYGFSWYPNVLAQQKAIQIFEKQLGKKFTLIRNVTLGNSKITVPFILIGPPGVQVIFVTHLQGTYRAKNDAWGTVSGGSFKEASINLLKRTAQFSKAVRLYIERLGFQLPDGVEPVLLSVNPGLHISSVRPIVRIVMSDAAERFAVLLAQEPPLMTVEVIHAMANEIANPKLPAGQEVAQEPKTVEKDTLFNFDDAEPTQTKPSAPPKAPVPQKPKNPPVKKQSFAEALGMTQKQLVIIGVMGFILICLLISVIMGAFFLL